MNDPAFESWVTQRCADGSTPEQIYLAALQSGHTVAQIEAALHTAGAEKRTAALQQRVVRIVLVVGAVLVGAGVFSFVAANWQSMSDMARIAVLIFGTVVFNVAGFLVRERTGNRLTGEALLLIGSTVFGASIFLVAQIFNVRGNWPDGFMLWMLGTLAMAYVMRSTGLHVLGLVLALIASIGYPISLLTEGSVDAYLLSSPVLAMVSAAGAIGAALLWRRRLTLGPEDRW